ncbi:hypothetical protein EYF80_058064 [Liparis tanakae]|uniref:Uncharacterized protein n=1 Tax=Liparis tanakae TaxID=230148 RepID=A0A4Z2ESJ7_9TELE|nr:hypothetical protein EYF80_058064 [Liparis tanakae]
MSLIGLIHSNKGRLRPTWSGGGQRVDVWIPHTSSMCHAAAELLLTGRLTAPTLSSPSAARRRGSVETKTKAR